MTEPETLATGQVLDGKYKIDATLGKGGMGMVYRAQHLGLNAYRAIKVMHNKFAEDEDFLRRFRNEAQLAEGLRHPNLCTLYDLSRLPDGSWYIVWEYVEGETLASMLQRGASFTLAQVTQMVAQVADGLAVAHKQKIVHRDISPDNLMLTKDADERFQIKVLDFGIAKALDEMQAGVAHTATGMFLGKPGYCSPEQISLEPNETLDERTDVFSLAVVTYQLITGKRPFRTSSIRTYFHEVMTAPEIEVRERYEKDLPESFRGAICRALSRDRETRTPNMARFKFELVEAMKLSGEPMGDAEEQLETHLIGTTPPSQGPSTGASSQTTGAGISGGTDVEGATAILSALKKNEAPRTGTSTGGRPPLATARARSATVVGRGGTARMPAAARESSPFWKLAFALPVVALVAVAAWWAFGPEARDVTEDSPVAEAAGNTETVASPAVTGSEPGASESTSPAGDSVPASSAEGAEGSEPSPNDNSLLTPPPSSIPVEPTPVEAEPPTTQPPSTRSTPPPTRRARPTELAINSTPSAEVRLDGRGIGRTPITVDVAPGEHLVELRTDTGERWSRTLNAPSGVTTELSPRLDQFGSLFVSSNVWANVILNDAELEQTPILYPKVLVGQHTVVLSRDGFRTQRLTVDVKEGDRTTLRVTMEPE